MPRSVTGDAVTDAIEENSASAADIFFLLKLRLSK